MTNGLLLPTKALDNGYIVLHPRDFDAKNFMTQLIRHAGTMCLKLSPPPYQVMSFSSYETMLPVFKELEAKKTRFTLCFDHKRSKSHGNLKLLERETGVLIIQICVETATRSGGNGQTLENLVLKMNAKTNGINYLPVIEKCGQLLSLQNKVMVIGIDVSLPTRGTAKELYALREKGLGNLSSHDAAIVGITANYGAQPSTILGDYFFQYF